MANQKNKILQALRGDNNPEEAFESLLISQKNLLKNHSNSVFNDKDKNKILKQYTNLQNLSKSLYRYNTLKENDFDVEYEKSDIENIVLKGGITYNKYVWHSENGEHTCDMCKSLDGKVFDFYDEVPERPHPNCRCTVEVVEEDDDKSKPQTPNDDEEPCDTIDEIESIISEIEGNIKETENLLSEVETDVQELENDVLRAQNLIQDANYTLESLSEEYGKHLPNCENNVDSDYAYMYAKRAEWQTLLHDVLGLLIPIAAFLNTLRIFISNYIELLYHAYRLHEHEMDKFYHSKANCEATQEMVIIGKRFATLLSNLKEKYDQYTYVHTHKVSVEEAIADSERDQAANRLGRERGRKYPYCDCSILMHDLLPDYKK